MNWDDYERSGAATDLAEWERSKHWDNEDALLASLALACFLMPLLTGNWWLGVLIVQVLCAITFVAASSGRLRPNLLPPPGADSTSETTPGGAGVGRAEPDAVFGVLPPSRRKSDDP